MDWYPGFHWHWSNQDPRQITYHPQSGWFEDTPLKGGTEEGCPLKGVHEGTFLIEAGHPAWNHSRASGLTVVLRLGLLYGLGSGLPHKTSSAPPQRRNGRACSSLTARGGGLPVGVTFRCPRSPIVYMLATSYVVDHDRSAQGRVHFINAPHGCGAHLTVTATLSQVLHTAGLPPPHDLIGYCWWHSRFHLRLIDE